VSKSGITINSGTLTGPEAWHSPKLSLAGGSLSIGFPGASASASTPVALEGSVTGDGLAFIPLPTGWTGSTTLTFSSANGTTALSIQTGATGPKNDTSPG